MQSATSNLYTVEIYDQEIVVEARLRGEVMISDQQCGFMQHEHSKYGQGFYRSKESI